MSNKKILTMNFSLSIIFNVELEKTSAKLKLFIKLYSLSNDSLVQTICLDKQGSLSINNYGLNATDCFYRSIQKITEGTTTFYKIIYSNREEEYYYLIGNNRYICYENNVILQEEKNESDVHVGYSLIDQQNNIIYQQKNSNYPSYINNNHNVTYTFTNSNGRIVQISDNELKNVIYTYDSTYRNTGIEIKRNTTNKENISLTYSSSGKIETILISKDSNQTDSFSFSLNDDNWIINDNRSKKSYKFNFDENNNLISFTEGFNGVFLDEENDTHKVEIIHEENSVIIKKQNNKYFGYIFNEQEKINYEFNDLGYINKEKYIIINNKEKVIEQSKTINSKKTMVTNNLLENGYFDNGFTGWTLFNSQTGAYSYQAIEDNYLTPFIGNNVIKIQNLNNQTYKMSQTIEYDFYKDKSYILMFFIKCEQVGISTVKITPYINDDIVINEEKIFTLTNDEVFDYRPFIEQITFSQYINKITITFEVKNNAIIYLGGIKLTEESYGLFSEYDSITGRVIYSKGIDGSESNFKYGNDNKIKNLVSKKIGNINIEYNETNNLPSKSYTASGLEVNYNYDQNNYLEREIISYKNTNGTSIYLLSTYGHNGANLSRTEDYNGKVITYSYDYVNERISQISYSTYEDNITYEGSKITDTYTDTTKTYPLINDITGNDKISYLKNNDIQYNYSYDSNLNLISVKLNSAVLEQYTYIKDTYSQNYLINSKKIINSSYNYTYDTNNNLTSIKLGTLTTLYSISYDELNRISSTTSNQTSRTTSYQYDNGDKITEINQPSYIEKFYYENDKLILKHENHNSTVNKYTYTSLDSGQIYNNLHAKLSKIRKEFPYYICFFDVSDPNGAENSLIIPMKNYYSNNSQSLNLQAEGYDLYNIEPVSEKMISCLKITTMFEQHTEEHTSGKLTYQAQANNSTSGTIAFWYKTSQMFETEELVQINIDGSNIIYLNLMDIDATSNLLLTVFTSSIAKYNAIIKYDINKNYWNFISLTYKKEGNNLKIIVKINEDNVFITIDNVANVITNTETTYTFAKYRYEDQFVGFNGFISGIMISPDNMIPSEEIRKYYIETASLFRSVSIEDEKIYRVKSRHTYQVDLSSTNVVSFNNSLITNKGKSPIENEMNVDIVFDGESNENVLPCFGNKLYYQTELIDTGFIMCKAKFIETRERQVVFCLVNEANYKIILYRNNENKLCINRNNVEIVSPLVVDNNSYNYIGISWCLKEGEDIIFDLKIYLNNQIYETDFLMSEGTFENYFKLYLGGEEGEYIITSLGDDYIETNPLIGYMNNVVFNDVIPSDFNTYITNIKPFIEYYFYDKFDRLCKTKSTNTRLLNTEISYKTLSTTDGGDKRTSCLVSDVDGIDGLFSYSYDTHNRITSWSKTDIQNHNTTGQSYSYDNFNQLIGYNDSSNNLRLYEYDNNGNITRIYNNDGTLHTFTYDTTSKCKLISYDDKTITYASSSFYPSSITRNGTTIRSFTFQVGRLVSFVNNEINLTTTYRYDIDGKRILKANTTNNIAYYYDCNNRLVKLINGTRRYILIFNYDMNGRLFSVEKRSNTYGLQQTYYYILNAFNDVLGLKLINGTKVCEYSYDAYGNIISSNSLINDDIINMNPFRYRSYYYDDESGYYYCNHRYYVPEWCRWLSVDESKFLTNSNINGLNLYCYCNNNPVMYSDPNGNSVIGTILIIVAAIFVIDAGVETMVLMTSEEYKAEKVFNGKEVEIPNSAMFNNPIAMLIYSNYLYNNVKNDDGSNYFENPYDIVGEWAAHNLATFGSGILLTLSYMQESLIIMPNTFYGYVFDIHKRAIDLNIGSNINEDDREVVRTISNIYKWMYIILTFNILNW